MTTAAPRGKRHADCLDHIRHEYARTGWICIASDEPERADAMRAFVDHLAEVAARHGAIERPAADGSHTRLSADAESWISANPDAKGAYGHDLAPEIRGRVKSWTTPLSGPPRALSQCIGHQCAPRPSTYAAPIKPKHAPRIKSAEPVKRAPIVELAADLIETGRALGILAPERSPFALPDPIEAPDALSGVTVITAEGIYSGTMRADDSIRLDGPAPDDGPAVVDLSAMIETAPGELEPVSIDEPARPEPEPARVPLAIVPPAEGRPSCARCGQTFRASGVGAAWHRVNRPYCARTSGRRSA